MNIKLAGVTFSNDEKDGGENRQDILAMLMNQNRNVFTADLLYTKYNNEFAIKVKEHATGKVIGWIPKTELETFRYTKVKQMTGFIECHHNKFCVRLDKQQPPTSKSYAYMKYICESCGWAMPAYDRRAYAGVFATFRALQLSMTVPENGIQN